MPSRIESGFISLPKVEQEQPEENIQILLNLPDYVDQDKIGVNLTGIAKLCRLGGIRQLVVIGNTDEEISHVIPEVVGLNSDGSAIASKKVARVTVPTFEMHKRDSSWRNISISTRATNLAIDINVDEVALRVSEKPKGVHSIGNWAGELDKGLKHPIRWAGNQNLLHNLERFDETVRNGDLGFLCGTTVGFSLNPPGGYNFESLILVFGLINGAFKAAELMALRNHPDFRPSLFPGPQVDRAIALGILSRTKTLIKDLSPDKK